MGDNLTPYSAADYEEGIRKTMPFYETFYSETISLVQQVQPDVRLWLDTGCGTGSLIRRAHPAFPSTRFLLADPSAEMLTKAAELLKEIPADQREIIGAVASDALPAITPAGPQVITSLLAHHYYDKAGRAAATRRCYELLEEGGLYVTFENIAPMTAEGQRIGLGRWQAFQHRQGKTEAEAADHVSRYGKAFFPITIVEHLELLKASGFRVAELFWFSNMQAGLYGIK